MDKKKRKKGSLAQLVQSVCLTSRGSGVRLPQLPPPERENQSKILKSGDFGIFCLWPGLQNGGIIDGNVGNVGINGKSMMISGGAAGGQHFGAPPGAEFISCQPAAILCDFHGRRETDVLLPRADDSWITHLRQKSSCWRLQRESHCRQFFYKGVVFLCLHGRTCLLCRRQLPRSTSHL